MDASFSPQFVLKLVEASKRKAKYKRDLLFAQILTRIHYERWWGLYALFHKLDVAAIRRDFNWIVESGPKYPSDKSFRHLPYWQYVNERVFESLEAAEKLELVAQAALAEIHVGGWPKPITLTDQDLANLGLDLMSIEKIKYDYDTKQQGH